MKPKGALIPAVVAPNVPVFELGAKKHWLVATASLIDGEFVVMEGSMARSKWAVVKHFRAPVQPLLAGKAKAMVVVSSRLEAV